MFVFNFLLNLRQFSGGLAQLARACDWQSQGQGFDSPNLHKGRENIPGLFYFAVSIKKKRCH